MLDAVSKAKLMKLTEQALSMPGKLPEKNLEMAMVFESSLEQAWLREIVGELVSLLKNRNEIFRNVRLNTIYWKGQDNYEKEVVPMPVLQMGRYFLEKETVLQKEKPLEELLAQLKFYYARSKLIYIFGNGDFSIRDQRAFEEALQPFLLKKSIWILQGTEERYKEKFPVLKNRMVILPE